MSTAREVYELADLREWPAATAGVEPPLRLAVFGDPVAHSASPPMHNAALEACGYHMRYTRIHVRPGELAEALQLAAGQGFVGVNLTMPHKAAAVALMDSVDEQASALGVINTVRFEGSAAGARLRGFNTDGPGFVRAVAAEFGLKLAGARVLILGAGGAGRAVALQCAREGCAGVLIVNRSLENAQGLVDVVRRGGEGLPVEALPWETEAMTRAARSADLIVNATSLGLKPEDVSPLAPESIPAGARVFDTVYRAAGESTPLEVAARAAGASVVGGRLLLLHQGAFSFEHWFGGTAPLDVMRRALG